MYIRRERPSERNVVAEIHQSAFAPAGSDATAIEVRLVDALRQSDAWIPRLSLVAQHQALVIGHVCLTRAHVGATPALALGPIGVPRRHQRAGVGSALMHAALGAADALDEPLVALLGHLDYYPRFGFVPGGTLGITPPEETWGDHFQVRTLSAYRPELIGRFRYAPPFDMA